MRAFPFHRLIVPFLSAALLGTNAVADDQVAEVQKALKAQEFFFGEVNGERDEETRAAVRRFQIHAGLPVTGEIDAATMDAVQNRRSDAAGADDEPATERSVRGQMRELVRSDEEFLKEVEATDEPGVNESAPRPAAPVRPIAPAEPRQPAISQIPPAPRESAPPRDPSPERISQLPPPPRPKQEEESRPPSAAAMTARQAEDFVRSYLQAAGAPTPEGEVSHYADRVDYFTSGQVNRRFIEKDQRNYYRRWPQRDFDLLDADLVKSTGSTATIRFRTRYSLSGKRDRATGRIENVVRLTRGADGEWKIASIRERKLSD